MGLPRRLSEGVPTISIQTVPKPASTERCVRETRGRGEGRRGKREGGCFERSGTHRDGDGRVREDHDRAARSGNHALERVMSRCQCGSMVSLVNEYSGWTPPRQERATIARVDTSITPEVFFTRFILPRRPAVIVGALEASRDWLNLARLVSGAGGDLRAALAHVGDAREATVRVEHRPFVRKGKAPAFGRGVTRQQRFGQFLRTASPRTYLTTQAGEENEDGRPPLAEAPARELLRAGIIPARPRLAGRLVPHSVNVWLGFGSKKRHRATLARDAHGTSSGLHHDFHDNMYVLLRGRKRFRLYSPADAASMCTAGAISRVHSNGLINYAGTPPTRADGAAAAVSGGDGAAWQARAVAAADRLNMAAADGDDDEMEAALEDALEADAAVGDDNPDDGRADPTVGPNSGRWRHRPLAFRKRRRAPLPDNFSMADPCRSRAEVRKRWPDLARARELMCDVLAGDMLYLPTGWFHEVTSFPAPAAGNADRECHCAINYWFHPPDGETYTAPYRDQFWERDFEHRLGDLGPV